MQTCYYVAKMSEISEAKWAFEMQAKNAIRKQLRAIISEAKVREEEE
jgi:hypothetical protein